MNATCADSRHPAISPFIGATPSGVRENRAGQNIAGKAQMVGEHALEHRAQIGRGLQVARLIKIGGPQSRPIGDDAPAGDRAAGEKRHRRRAVVGADSAVDVRGAAEFGDGDDDRILPALAEFALEGGEERVEPAVAAEPAGPSRRLRPRGCPSRRSPARRCADRRRRPSAAPRRRASFFICAAASPPGLSATMPSPATILSASSPACSALASAGIGVGVKIHQALRRGRRSAARSRRAPSREPAPGRA